MKVLLDGNFPLAWLRSLHADGLAGEHIITLGWRGASDARIRERLHDAETLFLTQDDDFLFGASVPASLPPATPHTKVSTGMLELLPNRPRAGRISQAIREFGRPSLRSPRARSP